MTVAQLLERIKGLQDREAKGEDVRSELADARQQLETIKANQGGAPAPAAPSTPLTGDDAAELERLRQSERERQERAVADQLVKGVVGAVAQDEAARAQRVESYVAEAITKALGGSDIPGAVEAVLKQHRGGSRFPGLGSSDQVLDQLAAGGSIQGAGDGRQGIGQVKAGEHNGVKAIEDRHNLAEFLSIVQRAKAFGPLALDDAEQQFIAKQFAVLRTPDGKAMAQGTSSAGGYLVPEQWMPDILTPLRAAAVVRRANPQVVQFDKQMNQVNMSSGATAYYTAENARITPSEPTVAQSVLLTPHYLTALVPASNILLGNWSQGDEMIRRDMSGALAVREDLAFLQGVGTGGEPTGFRNLASAIVNPLAPGANGFVPTLPQLRQIKGRTRMIGAPNPRWTWFFHPGLLTYLETLTDTTGRFLVDSGILRINEDGVSGTFDGFPFYCSYQIPVNLTLGTSTNVSYVLLVDMNDAVVGETQALSLAVSDQATYSPDGGTTHISAFQQNQTVFRAILGHDVNHRRPATGVIVQEGIRI